MEREITYKRAKTLVELRGIITDCLIQHSEARADAFMRRHFEGVFYEQGWIDCLRTIKDLISDDGLMLYRYKYERGREREEDKERDIL